MPYPQQGNPYRGYYNPRKLQLPGYYPVPIELISQNLQQSQNRYDTANLAQAETFAKLNEIPTYNTDDAIRKQQLQQHIKDSYGKIAEGYNYDLGAAAGDITSFIGNVRQDPFWKLNEYGLQQKAELDKINTTLKAQGKTPLLFEDLKPVFDKTTGQYRSQEDLKFDLQEMLDYQSKRSEIADKSLQEEGAEGAMPSVESMRMMEGNPYITIGSWKGVNKKQVEKKLAYMLDQYKDTDEYMQEKKKLMKLDVNPATGKPYTDVEAEKEIANSMASVAHSREHITTSNQFVGNPMFEEKLRKDKANADLQSMLMEGPTGKTWAYGIPKEKIDVEAGYKTKPATTTLGKLMNSFLGDTPLGQTIKGLSYTIGTDLNKIDDAKIATMKQQDPILGSVIQYAKDVQESTLGLAEITSDTPLKSQNFNRIMNTLIKGFDDMRPEDKIDLAEQQIKNKANQAFQFEYNMYGDFPEYYTGGKATEFKKNILVSLFGVESGDGKVTSDKLSGNAHNYKLTKLEKGKANDIILWSDVIKDASTDNPVSIDYLGRAKVNNALGPNIDIIEVNGEQYAIQGDLTPDPVSEIRWNLWQSDFNVSGVSNPVNIAGITMVTKVDDWMKGVDPEGNTMMIPKSYSLIHVDNNGNQIGVIGSGFRDPDEALDSLRKKEE